MNINSKKDQIVRICEGLEAPVTQVIMQKIQQVLGLCLFEDNKIHIQYDNGVSIDLDQPQFTDEKIEIIYQFVNNIHEKHSQ